ncbi:hypothetical protein JCM10449v2_003023 [Rhodotorula kratochvilovae]
MRSFALLSAALAVAPGLVAASNTAKDASATTTECAQGAVTTKHWGQHKHKQLHNKDFSRFWQHWRDSAAEVGAGTGEKEWSWSTAWATTITYGGEAQQTAAPVEQATSKKAAQTHKAASSKKEVKPKKTPTSRAQSAARTSSAAKKVKTTAKTTVQATTKPKATTRTRTTTRSTTRPAATTRPATTTRPAATTTTSKTSVAPAPTSTADAGSVEAVSLRLHNEFRAKHGVAALTWNTKLASTAQAWANKCVFEHGGGAAIGAGENLAAWSGSSSDVSQGVQMWYNEVSDYSFNNPGYSSATGHFTQMIWKGTTEIGCAVSKCAPLTGDGFSWNGYFYVCEYSAPGNIVGADSAGTAKSFSANVLAALS